MAKRFKDFTAATSVSATDQVLVNQGDPPTTRRASVSQVLNPGGSLSFPQLTVTGQVFGSFGTAASPGYSFTGAADSGMYRTSTSIGWSINGVEKMRLGDDNTLTLFGNISASATSSTYAVTGAAITLRSSTSSIPNTVEVVTGGTSRTTIDGSGVLTHTGNVAVTGTTTLTGNANITGNADIDGTAEITGNVGLGVAPGPAKLAVSGGAIFSGSVPSVSFAPNQSGSTPAFVEYDELTTKELRIASTNAAGTIRYRTGGNTDKFVMTADGRLYGTAVHNNPGDLTGTTNQPIGHSGTYTPTLTNTTNVAGSTVVSARWVRTGNVVMVSGVVTIDPTAADATTVLDISLPIASNFASFDQLSGTASVFNPQSAAVAMHGSCNANETNDRAQIRFWCGTDHSDLSWIFHFSYVVL